MGVTDFKGLLQKLKNKSNIDYIYYHLFSNQVLDIDYNHSNFLKNHIIYVLKSDITRFFEYYESISNDAITDVFLDSLQPSNEDFEKLCGMVFRNLFWIKIQSTFIPESSYRRLREFLYKNSLDVNRIFLQDLGLKEEFFLSFIGLKGFGNLSFLSLDHNCIGDKGLDAMSVFLQKNSIQLEYISLVGTNIKHLGGLKNDEINAGLRIVDISDNTIGISEIICLLEVSEQLEELFLKNINFTDTELLTLLKALMQHKKLYHVAMTLSPGQEKILRDHKQDLSALYTDISFFGETRSIVSTTFYIKSQESLGVQKGEFIKNGYFRILCPGRTHEFFRENESALRESINIFLFDIHDYIFVRTIIQNYACNYIYLENYFITDEDFIYFIESMASRKDIMYKVNLISIELSFSQLDYLIENIPNNIRYIEVNLNKIDRNREKYIYEMLQNPAFIFENMEIYQKILFSGKTL